MRRKSAAPVIGAALSGSARAATMRWRRCHRPSLDLRIVTTAGTASVDNHPVLLFTALLVLSLASGIAAYAGTRRAPRIGGIATAAALAALCIKSVLHWQPVWEAAVMPWTGYAWIQQFAIYPVVAVFFGFAAARLPIRWNRAVVAFVGLGFLTFGAVENSWIAWPQSHGRDSRADASGHLRQSTPYTCGPAACVSACAHVGVRVTERRMAELCLTRKSGSRLFNLYRGLTLALAGRDFTVRIEDRSLDQLMRRGSIAVTSNRGGAHALCLIGQGDRVLVHDPMYPAARVWSRATLAKNQAGPVVTVVAGNSSAANGP